jgi:hypothetical protein
MAGDSADAGLLSVDRSGQRVAAASAVVRAKRAGELLGADEGLVEKNALYRCLDKLLLRKRGLFSQQLILGRLKLTLPSQPLPRITAAGQLVRHPEPVPV